MFCNGFGVGGSYGGLNFFMMIPMIIILLMVVYFLHKAINSKKLNYVNETSLSKAMNILDERFAKGDINEDEYISRKDQLRK